MVFHWAVLFSICTNYKFPRCLTKIVYLILVLYYIMLHQTVNRSFSVWYWHLLSLYSLHLYAWERKDQYIFSIFFLDSFYGQNETTAYKTICRANDHSTVFLEAVYIYQACYFFQTGTIKTLICAISSFNSVFSFTTIWKRNLENSSQTLFRIHSRQHHIIAILKR